ncbi:MAG TPA: elongation factor G-like protein EF-G2 [Acidimicrobiales bacterium]|nr:elongation factor G-like protein EF-G2 [Acidimicrobiales bacterium]
MAGNAKSRVETAQVPPDRIRNVVLIGHAAAGKTTLVEALLVGTGVATRLGRIEDGTTICDHEEVEHRLGRSVSLAVASVVHEGVKINFIDTPGHPDFVGEVRAGLRAADAALFVVSAVDGVDGMTRMLWEECAGVVMPRAVVITHLDQQRADFDEALAIAQRVFGEGVQPLYLPLLDDAEAPAGLIGLLSQRVFDYSSGTRVERGADPEHLELVEAPRTALIEGIIQESEDDGLLDRWLSGDEVSFDTLVEDLEKAVVRGAFHPLLIANPLTGLGSAEVLEVVVRGFPSPLEHPAPAVTSPDGEPRAPLTADPAGPLAAEVVKTTTDPYVGRVSVVRIFSGTLAPDATVHVSGHFARFAGLSYGGDRGHDDHDVDERVGAVSAILGASLTPIDKATAGDIVAVARLTKAETGDTLSDPSAPALMEPWVMPEPLLPTALTAKTSADEDKLSQALGRLAAEDPTLRTEVNRDTKQVVVWSMGEAHLEVLLDRLRSRHGVEVTTGPVRVALRETLLKPGTGHGRHVKQSGGHGQYAVADIEVQPLPEGGGFEFVDRVVGGAVPRQFIPSVEKGVRAQMAKGVAAGYPMVDVRVTLVGGKAHSVDSSDAAFQMAGALALKEAAASAGIAMLEPIDEVRVVLDDEYVGAVMGDLSSRRGQVRGTTSMGNGRTEVSAEVPAVELTRYAVDLRSLAHGTGTFTRKYVRHAPMPQHQVEKVLAAAAAS